MKLLLDENLPHELRHELPGHEVFTVSYQGWAGAQNGRLLALAAEAGFDAILTLDGGIQQQQNRSVLPLGVVVIRAVSNDMDDLLPLVPAILKALGAMNPRTIVVVESRQ